LHALAVERQMRRVIFVIVERELRRTPGLLPWMKALLTGRTDVDVAQVPVAQVERALRDGLGPMLAHISARAGLIDGQIAQQIQAADLTARVLTGEKIDVLRDVLEAAAAVGCQPVLLKGVSAALRYYPEAHLRTMGDIDLLVRSDQQAVLEQQLRALGFRQASHEPPAAFIGRHHSMPFWHNTRPVCVEVHSRLHPRQYALAQDPTFSFDAVRSELSPLTVQGHAAMTMNHELHLVYTSARWAERFEHHRGMFAMLDVSLLLTRYENDLDWQRVQRLVEGSWSTAALKLMISFLVRCELVRVPSEILDWLRERDPHTNTVSIMALHRLIFRYLIQRREFGHLLSTQRNMETVWSVLMRPSTPMRNFLRLPYSLAGSAYREYIAPTAKS
jgi:hypothetical protein